MRRVLVVDDSPLLRQILSDLLAGESDLEVVGHCGSGEQAQHLVHELAPDVVVMDLEMPDMDGLEAAKAIGQDKPTPVVLLSPPWYRCKPAQIKNGPARLVIVQKPSLGGLAGFRAIKEDLLGGIREALSLAA